MNFMISKELLEENIKVLAEIPAKFSFGMIDALRKLPAVPDKDTSLDGKEETKKIKNSDGAHVKQTKS